MRGLFSKYEVRQYMGKNTKTHTWAYEAECLEKALKLAYIIKKESTGYNFIEIGKYTDNWSRACDIIAVIYP